MVLGVGSLVVATPSLSGSWNVSPGDVGEITSLGREGLYVVEFENGGDAVATERGIRLASEEEADAYYKRQECLARRSCPVFGW